MKIGEMITSNSNEQVKYLVQLRKNGRFRRQEGKFLVEGPKMFAEIPQKKLIKTYISDKFLQDASPALQRELGNIPYVVLKESVMKYVSDTQNPQGILSVVRMEQYTEADMMPEGKPALLLILENLQDPGNLGTILRSGEGAGVTGIVMTKETVDIYNPKVVRSTMGAIFRVPFFYTDCLDASIKKLKSDFVKVYAAHLKGTKSYDRMDYTGPSAFLIGNESAGLTEETAALADGYIRIPMLGKVESLNAAAAASILVYEAARQRRSE